MFTDFSTTVYDIRQINNGFHVMLDTEKLVTVRREQVESLSDSPATKFVIASLAIIRFSN